MNKIHRLLQIAVLLIPCSLGFLALINNYTFFIDTLMKVIRPLLSMPGLEQTGRAIVQPDLALVAFLGMSLMEGLTGLLALIGIVRMLVCINQSDKVFKDAKSIGLIAALLGVLVWGLGFFCIGGEYFLSWKNPDLLGFQASAGTYTILMAMVYLILK